MDEGVSIFSIVTCWGGSKHDWESGVFVCTGCADGRVRIWDVDKVRDGYC
jgi:WD40 repeat protein